jgi:hypothetical protein
MRYPNISRKFTGRRILAVCILTGVFGASADSSGAGTKKAPRASSNQTAAVFNPDPGSWDAPSTQKVADAVEAPPLSEAIRTMGVLTPVDIKREPLLGVDRKPGEFELRDYPLSKEGKGLLLNSTPVPNRWKVPLPHWQRYQDPSMETAYSQEKPRLWHPYQQSVLKGDLPILGEDIFANITAKSFTFSEFRRLPVPSGVSTMNPGSSEFYGKGGQSLVSTDTSLAVDLFRGQTSFKPVEWLLRINVVENENWVRTRENNLLNPDPRGSHFKDTGTLPDNSATGAVPGNTGSFNPASLVGSSGTLSNTLNPGGVFQYLSSQGVTPATGSASNPTRYNYRHKNTLALQEAFLELHLRDLSHNYDFLSSKVGIQPFASDFRGFVFSDSNLGARVFGNASNNKAQYNLLYFNMREKDTFSDLNTFDSRDQQVFIANLYRQDFLYKGYTTQVSFHANLDGANAKYDRNGFLVRPAPLGTVPQSEADGSALGHKLQSYYLGWSGDGHIGKFNVNHAFYQAFGHDELNQLAGRSVSINAQMAALELSLDRDWVRWKVSGFYASGDSNPTDGVARGFDSILDNPFFFGGPFSWYVREGINLPGTAVNVKERNSLVTGLRTSKTQGQSNFVNPGVLIVGLGTDLDVTPKLKAFGNLNYVQFAETAPVKYALQTDKARADLGVDASVGMKFRPFLTENVIVSAGVGFFFPGGGYKDLYRQNTTRTPGFDSPERAGKTDSYLYNALLTLTLNY